MAPEPSPEALAAQHADVAFKYIQMLMKDHEGKTDANVASALSSLAVYHQMRALTDQQRDTAERIQSNTDTLFHLSGGLYKLNGHVTEVRVAIERLNGAVEYAAQSPLRKATDRWTARWNDLRLRHMPVPPVSEVVRRPGQVKPAPRITPLFLIDKYDGTQFEKLLVSLLEEAGWDSVEHVGGNNDMGVDVIAKSGDVILAVQAKRYGPKNAIGSGALRGFVSGAEHYYKATALALVSTTDKYSDGAAKFLAGGTPIVVVGRAEVQAWAERGLIPEVALAPGFVPEPAPEPIRPAPPMPPWSFQPWITVVLAINIAALYVVNRHPQWTTAGLAVVGYATAIGCLGWLYYRWKLHGWRVGVRRYWPGWQLVRGKRRRLEWLAPDTEAR